MDLWTMRWRAPGRLPWKCLATFPACVPSPASSTELYSVWIKSQKVKTNRIPSQRTGTRRAPLIEEPLLPKQTVPPLPASRHCVDCEASLLHSVGRLQVTDIASVVLSRLDYGNAMLRGLPDYRYRQLQSVLNAAAGLIFRLRWSDRERLHSSSCTG